jgi:hypothetical protein
MYLRQSIGYLLVKKCPESTPARGLSESRALVFGGLVDFDDV